MKMDTLNDLINAHSQINALYLINASPPPPRCDQKLMKMDTLNDLKNAHSQINALYLMNAHPPPPPRGVKFILDAPL